jgi:hypothetical protein
MKSFFQAIPAFFRFLVFNFVLLFSLYTLYTATIKGYFDLAMLSLGFLLLLSTQIKINLKKKKTHLADIADFELKIMD